MWAWGPALMLPAAQPPAGHDNSLAIRLGRATLRAGLKPVCSLLQNFLKMGINLQLLACPASHSTRAAQAMVSMHLWSVLRLHCRAGVAWQGVCRRHSLLLTGCQPGRAPPQGSSPESVEQRCSSGQHLRLTAFCSLRTERVQRCAHCCYLCH